MATPNPCFISHFLPSAFLQAQNLISPDSPPSQPVDAENVEEVKSKDVLPEEDASVKRERKRAIRRLRVRVYGQVLLQKLNKASIPVLRNNKRKFNVSSPSLRKIPTHPSESRPRLNPILSGQRIRSVMTELST